MIFPARVGMNRSEAGADSTSADFPRASGDEPKENSTAVDHDRFSPREWG